MTYLAAALLGALTAGCESDCERVCEWSQECNSSGFDGSFLDDADCDDICDLSEEFAELVNCDAQWNDFVSCTADNLPDDCDGSTGSANACESESEAYSACFDDETN